MEKTNKHPLSDDGTIFRRSRQLPVTLVVVMWSLGLIEWSQTTMDSDGSLAPLEIVCGGKWKRRLLSVTSRLYLTVILSVNIYCGAEYVDSFFGKSNHFYHFATYLTYWTLMIGPQLICFFTIIRRWFHVHHYSVNREDWWKVFSESSVIKRIHPFKLSTFAPPKWGYFLLFSSFGIINMVMEAIHFYLYTKPGINIKHSIYKSGEFISTLLNMCFFSLFCYMLFILRFALDARFDNLILYVRGHCGDIAKCQKKLNECVYDFLSMQRLVRPWINIVVCLTSFGIAVCIAWVYKRIGEENTPATTIYPTTEGVVPDTNITHPNIGFQYLDALIFTNKITVLLLSLLAVGGTDLSAWRRYAFQVKVLRSLGHKPFWRKYLKIIRQLKVDPEEQNVLDMLLPLLLLALGILGVDNFDF